MSFPLRERGLKPEFIFSRFFSLVVVPLAGTWIETLQRMLMSYLFQRRSPCGNVD